MNYDNNFDLQLFAEEVEGGTTPDGDSVEYKLVDGQIQVIGDDIKFPDSDEEQSEKGETTDKQPPAPEDEKKTDDKTGDGEDKDAPKFKVKANGQEYELTLEQLLALAPAGMNFTTKSQKLADDRRTWEKEKAAQEELLRNLKTQVAQTSTPKDQKSDLAEAVEQAKARARAALGLAPDDELTELDFTHQAAFNLALKEIVDSKQNESIKVRRINRLEAELRSEEPLFEQVFEYFTAKVDNFPHKEYVELQQAWDTGDTDVIKKFFNREKKNFYAEKVGSSTTPRAKPPAVEAAGNTPIEPPKAKSRDASVLANLPPEEKARKLLEWDIV